MVHRRLANLEGVEMKAQPSPVVHEEALPSNGKLVDEI